MSNLLVGLLSGNNGLLLILTLKTPLSTWTHQCHPRKSQAN